MSGVQVDTGIVSGLFAGAGLASCAVTLLWVAARALEVLR